MKNLQFSKFSSKKLLIRLIIRLKIKIIVKILKNFANLFKFKLENLLKFKNIKSRKKSNFLISNIKEIFIYLK